MAGPVMPRECRHGIRDRVCDRCTRANERRELVRRFSPAIGVGLAVLFAVLAYGGLIAACRAIFRSS
jgi:hypothetical protein